MPKPTLRQWLRVLAPGPRPPEARHVPYLEFYVGRWLGAGHVWIAKKALKRGDVHEFNHCSAVIQVGNTDGNHADCPLDVPITMNPAMALRTVVQSEWEGP